jgi:hypothetical protein
VAIQTQREMWVIPCPGCGESSGPCRAMALNSYQIEVTMRCPACHHEWPVLRTFDSQPLLLPKADRRVQQRSAPAVAPVVGV